MGRGQLNADYGSLTERLVNRLERIEPVGGKVVQSRDPVERRTETIADEVRGRENFDTDDPDAAVAEANRVDAGRYALRKCLP